MPQPQFTPRQVLQRQMTFYPIAAALALVAAWGWWGWKAYVAAPPAHGLSDGTVWLVIAVIATVLVPIGVTVSLLKTRVLLQRGRMTQARVAGIGGAASNGRQSAKFTYAVDGQTYTQSAAVDLLTLSSFRDATTVPVIYDPQKPSRAQVFPRHSGVPVEEPSFVQEVVGETVDYIVSGGLLVGQLLIAFFVLKWLGAPYTNALIGPAVFAVLALSLWEQRLIEQWKGAGGRAYLANRRWRDRWMVLFAVVAIGWGAWAANSAHADEQSSTAMQQQLDKDREDRTKFERDNRAAIEQVQKLREQRNK